MCKNCSIFAVEFSKTTKKENKTMARPIAETPILYGEVGRRFETRMKEPRYESAEERADRIAAYNLISSLVVD